MSALMSLPSALATDSINVVAPAIVGRALHRGHNHDSHRIGGLFQSQIFYCRHFD